LYFYRLTKGGLCIRHWWKITFPIKKYIVNRIEGKIMRPYFSFLLVLALVTSAGCVQEYSPGSTTAATRQTPVRTTVPEDTPGETPAPAPEEMAYLANIQCAVGDRSDAAYHCNMNVRVRSGPCAVQVIARYPDNNTFRSGIEDLGGSNPIVKPFVIFPDIKYKGRNPDYFVKMDNTLYPVTWSGGTGTAWSNTPGAEGVDIP
jgi:hypothetical protein